MIKKAKVGRVLNFFKKGVGINALPKEGQKGLIKHYKEETPLLLILPKWVAKKVFGTRKVESAISKYFHKPIAQLDISGGQLVAKLTGKRGKHFFSVTEPLPIGTKSKFKTGKQEYRIPSLTAPARKVGAFGIPLLGAIKFEEVIKGEDMGNIQIKEADLKKTAAVLTALNEERNQLKKEAKATELLYKQAELGQIKMPSTFAQYQEKVAELLGKNLQIMEEAIKIASSAENELGGLDNSTTIGVDARTAFQQAILD